MQINNNNNNNLHRIGCEFQNGCPNGACRGDVEEYNCEENQTNANDDPQILRHLVFLILLLCSMFIVRKLYILHLLISRNFILLQINFDMSQGLSISVGTLIMEQLTGIYAELAFLDVALNFGQSLIAFAVFGLDPSLGKLGCWLQEMCRKWRSGTMNL